MSTIIKFQQQLRQEIIDGFNRIDSDALAMHTDLMGIMFFQKGSSLQTQIADLFHILVESSSGRTILFPTFNNEYFRTRIYNPLKDVCEVGALNEYVRKLYPTQRTLTPTCSFSIHNNRTFSFEPVENVYSKESTFGELVKYDSSVVFLGASFHANTFTHHIEEIMDIGYRYLKLFPGIIDRSGVLQKILLRYRVRPFFPGAVDYDWDRLELDLLHKKILHQLPLGKGKLIWYKAKQLMEYWSVRIKEDELFLLTDQSRKKVQELYAQFGKPLRCELIEKE